MELTDFLNRQRPEKWESPAFGAVLLGCGTALVIAALWIHLPYEINFAEGAVLGEAARIAHGLPAYPPATPAPYIINPYGPVAYYTFAMVVRIFGVSFTAPRVLVLLLAIGCATLIGVLIRSRGGTRTVSFIFGALFVAMPAAQKWLSVVRVDWIGVALALIGIYLFLRFERWYLPVIPFVAAIFCKFTILAAPTAVFLYLLSRRETKKALQFLACCVGLAGGMLLLLQARTGGWFWFHTVVVNRTHPFSIGTALWWIFKELRDCSLVLLLVALVLWMGRSERLRKALSFPAIYLGTTFLTLLFVGKVGADTNYYLEFEAAVCWCGGIGYSFLREKAKVSNWAKIAAATLLATAALVNVGFVSLHRHLPLYRSVSGCREAYQYVREQPGDQILAENGGAVILAGKTPGVWEAFMWARQVLQGGWSDAEVVEKIRERKYDLIVVKPPRTPGKVDAREGRWTEPVLKAVTENYHITRRFVCEDANVAYERKPQ